MSTSTALASSGAHICRLVWLGDLPPIVVPPVMLHRQSWELGGQVVGFQEPAAVDLLGQLGESGLGLALVALDGLESLASLAVGPPGHVVDKLPATGSPLAYVASGHMRRLTGNDNLLFKVVE